MECVGAVIALNDKTQNLDEKIIDIEKILVDPLNKKRIIKIQNRRRYSISQSKYRVNKCIKTRLFKIVVALCLLITTIA